MSNNIEILNKLNKIKVALYDMQVFIKRLDFDITSLEIDILNSMTIKSKKRAKSVQK